MADEPNKDRPVTDKQAPRREDYPDQESYEEAKAFHRHRTRPSRASRAT